jgi:hypothetical protein
MTHSADTSISIMKIHDFIRLYSIAEFSDSSVAKAFLPSRAFISELIIPTFKGANESTSIYVTLYDKEKRFVILQEGKCRIEGHFDDNIKI